MRIKSQPCEGKKRRTGEPCKNQAVCGARFCRSHGAALPNVREQARRNVIEAQAIEAERRNPLLRHQRRLPHEVILDAGHMADVIMQEAKRILAQGLEDQPPEVIMQIRVAIDQAAKTAKMIIDSQIPAKYVAQTQSEAQELANVVIKMLNNPDMQLTEDQISLGRAILRRDMLELVAEGAQRANQTSQAETPAIQAAR